MGTIVAQAFRPCGGGVDADGRVAPAALAIKNGNMDRVHAHQLLDRLEPSRLAAVGHLLEVMIDPVARAVSAAPPDDEPITEQDRCRFHGGRAWFAQHNGIPMEDLLAEFGPKPEDFPLPGDISR